jgi:very-short-patch-repair endonuclease
LAALAAGQWGVVSAAQLAALGFSAAGVTRRVQAGRLHRVHRGVYAVGHRSLAVQGRWLAAVLACGPGAVLSHRSAAAHWNLMATSATRIDVTAARGRRGHEGVRLHRSRSLDAQDTTTHQGIPITTVAKTMLDLAATLPAHRLERALAQAERVGLYDHAALTDVIRRSNGHRGRRALQHAVAQDAAFTRSDLEARLLELTRAHGLPTPLVNHILAAPDHPRLEVDFCWPSHQLIVETDTYATHGTRHAFEHDRRKDAALAAAGYTVLRFTDQTELAEITARLRSLLRP